MITQEEIERINELKSVRECLGQILYLCNVPRWEQEHEDRKDRITLIAVKAKSLLDSRKSC